MTEGPTVTVEALEEHPYDGVMHQVGDRYEAQADHVEFLTLRHWVRLASEPAADPDDEAPAKAKRRR